MKPVYPLAETRHDQLEQGFPGIYADMIPNRKAVMEIFAYFIKILDFNSPSYRRKIYTAVNCLPGVFQDLKIGTPWVGIKMEDRMEQFSFSGSYFIRWKFKRV